VYTEKKLGEEEERMDFGGRERREHA